MRASRASAACAGLLLVSCALERGGAEGVGIVAPPARRAHGVDACPLTIEGVRADIETTGRGSTVTLTASPDQLMLLRARAHAVTNAPGGMLAACPCAASSGEAGPPPAADVSVEDIEGGTRILEAARDPSDAHALGKLVRTQLALVHGGECASP